MLECLRNILLWLASLCLAGVAASAQTHERAEAESRFLRWATSQTDDPVLGGFADSARAWILDGQADRAIHELSRRRDGLLAAGAAPGTLAEGHAYAGIVWSYTEGRHALGKALLLRTLDAWPERPPGRRSPERATLRFDVLDALIRSHYWLFETELALQLGMQSCDEARAAGSVYDRWRFTQWIGRALESQGEWEGALRSYAAAQELAAGIDDVDIKWNACLNIACTLFKKGDPASGLVELRTCAAYATGEPTREAVTRLWEGSMYNALGSAAEAEAVLAKAQTTFDSLHLVDRAVHALMERATAARTQGRYAKTVDLVGEAFDRVGDARTPYHELYAYDLLYTAYKGQGEYERALGALERLREVNARLDSINSSKNIQSLSAKYEAREREQVIAQQEQTLARQRWLAATLILAVALLCLSLAAVVLLARNRRLLTEKSETISLQAAALQRSDEAKTKFFANIAHELRTPITMLLGPLDSVLREEELSARGRKTLEIARRGGGDLLRLVNESLDMFRLEAGQLQLHERPVELREFVGALIQPYRVQSELGGLDFSLIYEASEGLRLLLDRDKVSSILNNLLGNAFKFTRPGGRVRLTVRDTGSRLWFEVTDTGPGIHADDLPHVFDRYYQASADGWSSAGGTGIGLSMVREYSQLLGGSVRVSSQVGVGTTFEVGLPRKEYVGPIAVAEGRVASEVEPAVRPTEAHEDASREYTVLVVEDHHGLRAYIAELLAPRYRVLTAVDGLHGLEVLGRESVDLVLSDVMMPQLDGYAMVERLRENDDTRHLPVVFLTARGEEEDRRKAIRLGVDDYLVKPFDARQLLATLESLLGDRIARDEGAPEDGEGPEEDAGETVHVPGPRPARRLMTAGDQAWLAQFENYLTARLHDDRLTVPMMGEDFAMSESTLLRQLRRLTGLTPAKYLQEVRLAEARRLLDRLGADAAIKGVAAAVGYDSARTFSRSFSRRFGLLPSEYARQDAGAAVDDRTVQA